MNPLPKKRPVSVSLELGLLEAAKREALARGCSLSALLERYALETLLSPRPGAAAAPPFLPFS